MQTAREPLLPIRQRLHPSGDMAEIACQRFHGPRRAPGGPHGCDEKGENRQHEKQPHESCDDTGVVERVGGSGNLDHVRPNNLSISASFSST